MFEVSPVTDSESSERARVLRERAGRPVLRPPARDALLVLARGRLFVFSLLSYLSIYIIDYILLLLFVVCLFVCFLLLFVCLFVCLFVVVVVVVVVFCLFACLFVCSFGCLFDRAFVCYKIKAKNKQRYQNC